MAEVVLPELDEVDVDLVPRRTLGDAGGDRVAGQVSIGRAQAIRLYPDADGAGDEDHYYLVSLSCTFRQGDAPVVSAVFSIELVQAEIIGVTSPVVWSMDPLRRATAVKHRRVVSVGPNLKIVPDVVEFDTSIEHSAEYTVDVNHLVAEGEGERQVDWTFTATKAVDLVGVHQLSLVARTSSRSAVHAVSTGANLGHRGAVKGSERHGMATNGSQRHRLTCGFSIAAGEGGLPNTRVRCLACTGLAGSAVRPVGSAGVWRHPVGNIMAGVLDLTTLHGNDYNDAKVLH